MPWTFPGLYGEPVAMLRTLLANRWAWSWGLSIVVAGLGSEARAQAPSEPIPAPQATQPGLRKPGDTGGSGLLRKPGDTATPPPAPAKPVIPEPDSLLQTPVDPPLGFSGPSSVLPVESQTTSDFIPVEDRWRIGYPDWDRYGLGHPPVDDYPYVL